MHILFNKKQHYKKRQVGAQVKCYQEYVKPTEMPDMNKQPQKKSSPLQWEIIDRKASNHEVNISFNHIFDAFLPLHHLSSMSLQHLYTCQCNARCSASGISLCLPSPLLHNTYYNWMMIFLHIQLVHVALEQWHHLTVDFGGLAVHDRRACNRVLHKTTFKSHDRNMKSFSPGCFSQWCTIFYFLLRFCFGAGSMDEDEAEERDVHI